MSQSVESHTSKTVYGEYIIIGVATRDGKDGKESSESFPSMSVSEPTPRTQRSFITVKYLLITTTVATLAAVLGISQASSRNAQGCTFLASVSILKKIFPDRFTARG